MKTSKIGQLVIITALVSLCLGVQYLKAQDYPKKPVTMIVTSAAGGGSDLAARALVEATKPYFPQSIIVENKPGGGGVVAAAGLISSPHDGYTIAALSLGSVTLSGQVAKVPYELSDLMPITGMIDMPIYFIVNAKTGWKTMKEVLDYGKANPGKIRVASPSAVGGVVHLIFEDMRLKTQADMTYVPFSAGAGAAITAVLGGHCEATIIGGAPVFPHLKSSALTNIAAFTQERTPHFPNVPTFRELGYNLAQLSTYFFLAAPKETPKDTIQTLYSAFSKGLKTDKFQKFAYDSGSVVVPWGPDELKKRLETENALFKEILKKIKLQ